MKLLGIVCWDIITSMKAKSESKKIEIIIVFLFK